MGSLREADDAHDSVEEITSISSTSVCKLLVSCCCYKNILTEKMMGELQIPKATKAPSDLTELVRADVTVEIKRYLIQLPSLLLSSYTTAQKHQDLQTVDCQSKFTKCARCDPN